MTYTGLPPVNFARDLPAALGPRTDVWIRTDTGDETLVATAIRTGDTITVTTDDCNWPRANTSRTIILAASDRIATRVY